MATINPRKGLDGNNKSVIIGWQAIIRKRGYPSQSKTFRTKRDAESWAKITESEMLRGVWRDQSEAESTTLTEALNRYAREISTLKKGVTQEISIINKLKESPLSRMYLAAIRGKDIAKHRDDMLSDGYSPYTIQRRLSLLSHLFTVATKEWGISGLVNPVPLVRIHKSNNARDRRFIGDEEFRLLTAAQEYGEPLPSIIRFALETGMRRGEIAHMLWQHIDMKTAVLLVPDSKNGDTRHVPLSTHALKVLNALPRRVDGQVWGIRADSITQAFERICKRAGIEDLRFHDLRHEATSRFFEQGFTNPLEVAAITGHKDLKMLKRYTHFRAEDLAKKLQ